MITYGSRRFGLQWSFDPDENTFVRWAGHGPDYMIIPREDYLRLLQRLGSPEGVHEWAAERLDPSAISPLRPTQSLTFSNFL